MMVPLFDVEVSLTASLFFVSQKLNCCQCCCFGGSCNGVWLGKFLANNGGGLDDIVCGLDFGCKDINDCSLIKQVNHIYLCIDGLSFVPPFQIMGTRHSSSNFSCSCRN